MIKIMVYFARIKIMLTSFSNCAKYSPKITFGSIKFPLKEVMRGRKSPQKREVRSQESFRSLLGAARRERKTVPKI
jgi:hypothetical protein